MFLISQYFFMSRNRGSHTSLLVIAKQLIAVLKKNEIEYAPNRIVFLKRKRSSSEKILFIKQTSNFLYIEIIGNLYKQGIQIFGISGTQLVSTLENDKYIQKYYVVKNNIIP